MNFRRYSVGLLGLALVLTACAGPAQQQNGADGLAPQEWDEEDLPEWIRELPEGTEPRDDEHTQEALLRLLQGHQTDDEERARELYDQVLQAAEAAIENDPGNPQGYYLAGEALMAMDRVEEAGQMLDRAEEIYPRYILETEVLREQAWIDAYNEAIEHIQQADMDAALPYLEQAHRIYQGRPDAMIQLAGVYTERGRLDEAARLYAQAIELMEGPRSEDLTEELASDWEEFLEISRFNRAQILFRLAQDLEMEGNRDEAQELYAEAAGVYEAILNENPEDLLALRNLAVALTSAGDTDRASQLYDELLARPDLNARDYFDIGVGLFNAAHTVYEGIIEEDPEDEVALRSVGEEFGQAARAFRESWQMVPQNRDALFNQAMSLNLAEDWQGLIEAGENLLEMDPYNVDVYRFLYRALIEEGREDQAEEVVETWQRLPFEIGQIQIQPFEDGVIVGGQITNGLLDAGEEVALRFYLYDVDGESAGTAELSVPVGEPGEPVGFQAEIPTDADVFGFSYEVVG